MMEATAITIELQNTEIMDLMEATGFPDVDENISDLPDPSMTPVNDNMDSKLVTMTTMALLSLAIFVNFIALAAVSCDPRKRNTKANIYAASFFIAEIMYCLNTLVSHYHRFFLSPTEFEHVITHGHLFLEFACRGAMVISLMGVVIDRYRATYNVTSYCPRQSLCVSCCYALAGWVVSVLLAVPILAGLTDYWYTTYNSLRPFDLYTSIHTALLYFLPLLIFTLAFNALMCRLLSCSRRQSLDSVAMKGNEHHRSARRRIATGIITTVVVFAISWFIFLSVRVIDGYFPPADFEPINMVAFRLAGNLVAYMGLSTCPIFVCVLCADYKALDTHRSCPCCSDDQKLKEKIEQTWPSSKSIPYYL